MSTDKHKVIVYAYNASPMFQKLRNILILKRIPYSVVRVTDKPPRPALLSLGITYRRIPVMSIGNDVFFDTSLMIAELERRFTPEIGHPSIMSANSAGLEQILMTFYADTVLFENSSSFLPVENLSEELKKDRRSFNPKMRFELMESERPDSLSKLRSHLVLIQKQLAKSTTSFLLGTPHPSLVDIAFFTLIHWAIRMKSASSVLVLPASKAPQAYRRVMEWVEAVQDAVSTAAADPSNPATTPEQMSGDTAAQIVLSSPTLRRRSIIKQEIAVDQSEPLVQNKWLSEGDIVTVTPTDTGRVPQVGRLVGLTSEVVSLHIQPPGSPQSFLGHFPRLGYVVSKESPTGGPKAKL